MEPGRDSSGRPACEELTQPGAACDSDASLFLAGEACADTRTAEPRVGGGLCGSLGTDIRPLERSRAAPPPSTPTSSTDSADHMSDRAEIPSRIVGTSAAATTALNGSRRRCGFRAPTVRSTITLRVDRPSCGRLTSAARSLLLRAAFFWGRCRRRLYDNAALSTKTDACHQGRGGHPLGTPPRTIPSQQNSSDKSRAPPRSS
jgi:hypothetical protein